MQTIRQVAKHWGLNVGELLDKAKALGLADKEADSQISPDEQRDLKRVRSLSPDQIATFVRRAPKKETQLLIKVPAPEPPRQQAVATLPIEPLDRISYLEKQVDQMRADISAIRGRFQSLEDTTLENLASLESKPNQSFLAEQELRSGILQLKKKVETIEREVRQAVSAEDRSALFLSIGDIQRNVDVARREISANAAAVNKARETIDRLQQQLTDVRSEMEASHADQKQAEADSKRIETAIVRSQSMISASFSPSVERLKKTLEEDGYYFQHSLFEQCIQALIRSRPLLLVGPPGTGKSTLARHLPLIFWEASANSNFVTTVEANEQWTPFDILGGKWPVGDRIVPKLGIFSESVVRCVEQAGRHWLFIDEFNRADVDKAFAGLLGTIGALHEGAQLNIPATMEPLRIPKSFRLICAMNDADDRHLFPISTAILGRFEIVRVDPPEIDLERIVVRRRCSTELQRATHAFTKRRQDKEQIDVGVDAFLAALSEFRRIGIHTGAKELILGLRDSISIAQRACVRIEQHEDNVMHAFGDTIMSVLSSRMEAIPNEALRILTESEIIRLQFSNMLEPVHQELEKRIYVTRL